MYTKDSLIEIWKESSRELGSDKLDIYFEDLAEVLNGFDSKPKNDDGDNQDAEGGY
jgi:hypothetical protein